MCSEKKSSFYTCSALATKEKIDNDNDSKEWERQSNRKKTRGFTKYIIFATVAPVLFA